MVGHFGPELRRFVLAQHHQGQVTVPRLVAQLRGIGVSISKRQVMRLLIAGQDGFLTEARDVLRVGLETALGNCHRARKLERCRELLGMTPAAPADPPADYRDRYEALTGQSLRACPHCHTGLMVVIDSIARSRVRLPVPDTS